MQQITTIDKWNKILEDSKTVPIIIYKHSLTCPACDIAKAELEEGVLYKEIKNPIYIVITQESRDLAEQISTDLRVGHESPQAIIVNNRRACFVADHEEIHVPTLAARIDLVKKNFDELFG